MDYLKTPNQLNWTNGEQLYPGVAEQVFDPEGINAPYLMDNVKAGYCMIAHFWLACQPDEAFFQRLIQVPHQKGSITEQIYQKKIAYLERSSGDKPIYSSLLADQPWGSLSPFILKMVFHPKADAIEILEAVYLLTSQPGRYLIRLTCQNKRIGKKLLYKKHCFSVYHSPHKKDQPHTIKIFDWRFGCYQFTSNHATSLHLILSTITNYYIGIGTDPGCISTMSISRATFAKKHWEEFIAEYQTKFFPSST